MQILFSVFSIAQAIAVAPALSDSNATPGAGYQYHQQLIEHGTVEQKADASISSEGHVSAAKTTDLEAVFWLCDYAQSTGNIRLNMEALCSTVADELRRVKFGGEFERLLAWWQANRMARYLELDQALAASIAARSSASEKGAR